MRRFLLITLVLAAVLIPLGADRVAAKSHPRCKTVTVKVHGHKTKKRICKKQKKTATPTSYPTFVLPTYLMDRPSDIAIDGAGNILVTDTGNNRIDKFSPEGALITSWHKSSSGTDQFQNLYGIALDGAGTIYVADAQAHEVDKLSPDGTVLTRWNTQPVGTQDSFPTLLTVDSQGTVYVSDFQRSRVLKLAPDGTVAGDIGVGKLAQPYGVTLDSTGNLYVADYGGNTVAEFAPDGTLLATWGDGSNRTILLRMPEAIRVDPAGTIYVTEGGQKNDLVKFGRDGKEIARWGGLGSAVKFADPAGMTFDAHGNIWIVEYGASQIKELSPDGTMLKVIH